MKGVYERKPRQSTCPRRQSILDFIQVYLTRNGYSPTYEEIRSGVGLGSTNTVEYHIRQMKKDGLLIHDPARPRSLVPVTTA